jgi:hypothetical protein
MCCVIKCVKTKRVLKGNFASSIFHSCNTKTQMTQICVTGLQCVTWPSEPGRLTPGCVSHVHAHSTHYAMNNKGLSVPHIILGTVLIDTAELHWQWIPQHDRLGATEHNILRNILCTGRGMEQETAQSYIMCHYCYCSPDTVWAMWWTGHMAHSVWLGKSEGNKPPGRADVDQKTITMVFQRYWINVNQERNKSRGFVNTGTNLWAQ